MTSSHPEKISVVENDEPAPTTSKKIGTKSLCGLISCVLILLSLGFAFDIGTAAAIFGSAVYGFISEYHFEALVVLWIFFFAFSGHAPSVDRVAIPGLITTSAALLLSLSYDVFLLWKEIFETGVLTGLWGLWSLQHLSYPPAWKMVPLLVSVTIAAGCAAIHFWTTARKRLLAFFFIVQVGHLALFVVVTLLTLCLVPQTPAPQGSIGVTDPAYTEELKPVIEQPYSVRAFGQDEITNLIPQTIPKHFVDACHQGLIPLHAEPPVTPYVSCTVIIPIEQLLSDQKEK